MIQLSKKLIQFTLVVDHSKLYIHVINVHK